MTPFQSHTEIPSDPGHTSTFVLEPMMSDRQQNQDSYDSGATRAGGRGWFGSPLGLARPPLDADGPRNLLRLRDAPKNPDMHPWSISGSLKYICGKCLASLDRTERGAWRHGGEPNCGQAPVPMIQPLHSNRLRRDDDARSPKRRAG